MEKTKRGETVTKRSPKYIRLPLDTERKIMLNVFFINPEKFRVFLDDGTELKVELN